MPRTRRREVITWRAEETIVSNPFQLLWANKSGDGEDLFFNIHAIALRTLARSGRFLGDAVPFFIETTEFGLGLLVFVVEREQARGVARDFGSAHLL
jgi:hypothetical protein